MTLDSEGYRTLYSRLPRLLQDLTLARADGRYGKVLRECVEYAMG